MIRIEKLCVRLPGFSLESADLRIAEKEFFTIIGPTGAGKTLILESVAGLVAPNEGKISIDGKDVTALPPERRGVGIVYQDHALFPHLTVEKNIRYGLRYSKRAQAYAKEHLESVVHKLGLERLLHRYPETLSGGEKQRTALARALAVNPRVLLLDEPLSALDPNIREEIRQMLKRIHRETGITILMVTHDFAEAHFLAQRVGVIHQGRMQQVGSPADVFYRPANSFTAEFVGMKNFYPATFEGRKAKVENLEILLDSVPEKNIRYVGVRPEDVRIQKEKPLNKPGRLNVFSGRIEKIVNHGFFCDVQTRVAGVAIKAALTSNRQFAQKIEEDDEVFVSFHSRDVHQV